MGRLREAGVEVVLGADADVALVERVQVLVQGPGVPSEAPLVAGARELGVPVWSEIELGARLVAQPTVAVTGTNGKTTTTELLGAIFRAAGRPVAVCGNVGRPLCGLDGKLSSGESVVCELSSFQLEDVETLRCHVAVLLNLTPDHLDRHGSLDAYREAKLRIFERQEAGDAAVVPTGFSAVRDRDGGSSSAQTTTCPPSRSSGAHNRENAAAATAAARAAGIADDSIAEALRIPGGRAPARARPRARGRALRQRLEGHQPGVGRARPRRPFRRAPCASSSVAAASKAEFDSLARVASRRAVVAAYLIGETAGELADAFESQAVAFERCGELENAGRQGGRRRAAGRDSPAVGLRELRPVQDFEQRGERFREIVEALA